MKLVLIILVVTLFDWLLGSVISYYKNKQLKKDEDLFVFKLEQILQNTTISQKERINKAKELCRNTKGKMSSGAYFALDRFII
jgi:anaerobic C4-dicarboxylate transporter